MKTSSQLLVGGPPARNRRFAESDRSSRASGLKTGAIHNRARSVYHLQYKVVCGSWAYCREHLKGGAFAMQVYQWVPIRVADAR